MTTSTKLYTPQALKDLQERIEYEAWLLETVYKVANRHFISKLIYPKNGDNPKKFDHGFDGDEGGIYIGDWRAGFKKECAPLVFVTAFKLLDSFIEWILIENSKLKHPSSKFCVKIKAIEDPPAFYFPDVIESRSWLRERFIAFYEQFEPLRGTVIHNHHFTNADGILEICPSKKGIAGSAVRFTEDDLRNIVHIFIPVIRAIESGKSLDANQEKFLRYRLDTLSQFHNFPPLGQLLPAFLKVSFYDSGEEQFEFDISKIEKDIAENYKDRDVMSFDIHIADSAGVTTHIIPWDKLQTSTPKVNMTRAELSAYVGSSDILLFAYVGM